MDINLHLTVGEANALTILLGMFPSPEGKPVEEKLRLAVEKYERDERLRVATSPCHEACQG